ncbi:UDP-N-acetylmuramoyl-L-alanine--D-glutamate ligase [Conexibacter sp. CPCC 206217]|uniref:UDP-N-acetylmuramoyl-L-alanine--D-glutamate ligase n=1 Tax=Conexibacter sp. CPCC 206217 TaxID=3064574 RepID=UPI0027172150|nr:UDP-N-acetylmuramoyl-L-alanine--D-glutamate ligase [Conexibacter sp. CPCC 206217]MDO8212707.1 UDP-N-acetylmuramoyl-L-alanine--D-glutamate ligase [Conexibacter sp. CPCC 206217]
MSRRPALPGGPYLVVGLARSGIAAALLLHARGERVIALDAGTPDVERLRAAGVEVHLDGPGTDFVSDQRTLVKSPGVPHSAPVVAAARERGLPVLGEVELSWSLLPNEFIAVTGTNGKTTTTELLGHVHRTAGLPVAVAGNVGTAVASLVGALEPAATVVCETSSYQLEDTLAFAPEAALLLNVTPDHLDRHGTFEAYRDAKLEAFRRQDSGDVAVTSTALAELLPGRARRVTFGTVADGATIALHPDGAITWEGAPLIASEEIRIRGPHNRENAMAAAGVALARGIEPDAVREALRTFAGVAHRLEPIRELDGVAYVNDSKATNVDATQVALRSFAPHTVHLIAGGVPKAQDFTPLAPLVAERCAAVYLIGEGAQEIAAAWEPAGVPMFDARDMAGALLAARAASQPGETVLLSPACASFDQYENFEARGDHFRRLVEEA